ncbi:Pimeloyl-ACP methyl ester carboxylesterase [Duganella sp. CF402]|uniref:alpha/beta fold hydrolase n=1 Tax=unclassified Duganella TaxID=2636909 RepID=UPI0008B77844|nr:MULTISPECIES: alpha/beta hydrolase [unclassified Duganella]RZT08395.1 pimeloyl-ACP methyl ester carboxylesterase [Duganella sp. BK701]SEL95511.1 Pimeloyl-ACP methyl ester carboxylesterase [Duganella sp. CF402]
MNKAIKGFRQLVLAATLAGASLAQAAAPSGYADKVAQVNGTQIHYMVGGKGTPLVLLHGYTQNGHMWRPVMAELAKTHTVIVPDLRGAGASAKPAGGYEKADMATDIHELVKTVSNEPATVVGHDIGLMVAYAYAAQYPQDTSKVALMDAFLPGIGNWKDMFLLRDLWHFHFFGETPEQLVKGRERTYFEHFWNDFAADRHHSIPEADRKLYAAAYAQPGAIHAGFEYFKAFPRDAERFAELGKTKLTMPVLVIAGEKSGGEFLVNQVKLVANDVDGKVIQGSGHWLMEEAPQQTIPALIGFIK